MEVESPCQVKPILEDKHKSLNVKDVEHFILFKEHNTEMPFRPKGGEIYVFHPKNDIESRDWVADGHSFSCEGTRKVKGNSGELKKYYYYLHVASEGKKRITDKRFRKEVYVPLSENFKNIAVIHYIGDASVSKPKAHGNCIKQTKISVRPKPSLIKKIEENLTKIAKSKEIISRDRISFVPKMGCFVILGSTGQLYTVKIFPTEKCSCLLPNNCCHILSVKMALRMDVDVSVPTKSVNLTVLPKNARGKKKPGRKQPRPGDTDYELPDDSEVKRAKLSTEEPCTSVNDIRENAHSSVEDVRDTHTPCTSVNDIRENARRSVEDVRDTHTSVNDVRDSINSVRIEITEESFGRIDGTVDNGWLDDSVIDAAQTILKKQYPNINGFQSCVLAETPCFRPTV